MAENKKSFLLYCDLIHTIKHLSDEEAGEVFKWILQYVNDKQPEPIKGLLAAVCEPIKQQLKRDLIKYEGIKQIKSDSGQLGNLKRWHKDIYNRVINNKITLKEGIDIAKGRIAIKKVANIAVTVTDTVTDTDNVNDINKRKEEFKNSLSPFYDNYGPDLLNDFFSYWTEKNPKGKKMRFELEKVFDVTRRINTWEKRQKQFNKTDNNGDTKSRREKFISSYKG